MLDVLHFEANLGVVVCHRCQSGVVYNSANSINNYFRTTLYYLRGVALQDVYAQFKVWNISLGKAVLYLETSGAPVAIVPHLKIHAG